MVVHWVVSTWGDLAASSASRAAKRLRSGEYLFICQFLYKHDKLINIFVHSPKHQVCVLLNTSFLNEFLLSCQTFLVFQQSLLEFSRVGNCRREFEVFKSFVVPACHSSEHILA